MITYLKRFDLSISKSPVSTIRKVYSMQDSIEQKKSIGQISRHFHITALLHSLIIFELEPDTKYTNCNTKDRQGNGIVHANHVTNHLHCALPAGKTG